MRLAASIIATSSIGFKLPNHVSRAKTYETQIAFPDSFLSFCYFHLLELFTLPNSVFLSVKGHCVFPEEPRSLVAAKHVVSGFSLLKVGLALSLLESNCQRRLSCTRTIFFSHALNNLTFLLIESPLSTYVIH